MTNKKLNSLVISYRNGETTALKEIYNQINPVIARFSKEIWYKIKDDAAFECQCLRQLERAIKDYDQEMADFKYLAYYLIKREAAKFVKRKRRKLETTSLEKLTGYNENEETLFQPTDKLAFVEDEILLKEKIALLAQGDSRSKVVLNEWMKGCTNDSALAKFLAERFEGKIDSHRRFITRFRTDCQELLSHNA